MNRLLLNGFCVLGAIALLVSCGAGEVTNMSGDPDKLGAQWSFEEKVKNPSVVDSLIVVYGSGIPSSAVLPSSSSAIVIPPSSSTIILPPSSSTIILPPSSSTIIQPPSSSTIIQPPSSSSVVIPPSSSSSVVIPPSSSSVVVPPSSSSVVTPSSGSTGNNITTSGTAQTLNAGTYQITYGCTYTQYHQPPVRFDGLAWSAANPNRTFTLTINGAATPSSGDNLILNISAFGGSGTSAGSPITVIVPAEANGLQVKCQ